MHSQAKCNNKYFLMCICETIFGKIHVQLPRRTYCNRIVSFIRVKIDEDCCHNTAFSEIDGDEMQFLY